MPQYYRQLSESEVSERDVSFTKLCVPLRLRIIFVTEVINFIFKVYIFFSKTDVA